MKLWIFVATMRCLSLVEHDFPLVLFIFLKWIFKMNYYHGIWSLVYQINFHSSFLSSTEIKKRTTAFSLWCFHFKKSIKFNETECITENNSGIARFNRNRLFETHVKILYWQFKFKWHFLSIVVAEVPFFYSYALNAFL